MCPLGRAVLDDIDIDLFVTLTNDLALSHGISETHLVKLGRKYNKLFSSSSLEVN